MRMTRSLAGLGVAVVVLTAGTCPGATDSVVTLSRVVIFPSAVTLPSGQHQQFGAYGRLSNGDSSAVPVDFTGSGGSIDGTGLYSAGPTPGVYQVVATQHGGELADTATVTIPNAAPALVRLLLAPDSVTLDTAASQQFSAVGKFSDSSTAAVPVTFSATGGTISSDGLYSAGHAPGTYRVIATEAGGHADTSRVTIVVPAATLVRIILSPDSVTLDTAATQQFSAVGKFSDSSSAAVAVTYSATGGTISAGGLYTGGHTAGTYRVIAKQTSGSLADTSQVRIVLPALVRVMLSPDSVTLDTAGTKQFSVVGKYSDSSTAAVTVTYSATGGTISTGGLYTAGHTAGTYRVIATQSGGSLADTSQVKIVLPTLVRVILSPDSVTLDTAATKQFSVVGRYSDSSTAAVAVNYSATGGTISAGGLYTAGKTPGTFRVTATQSGGSLADTSRVTIQVPSLVRVILSPDSVTLDTAATKQFSVVGKYSDSSTAAVAVNYSATGGTISSGGLYTAGHTPGTFRVIAIQSGGSLADTSKVTVQAASSSAECANPQPGWIWCDDFEQNRFSQYFEVDTSNGDFVRVAGVGLNGSTGIRSHFAAGQVSAGSLHLGMGLTPQAYIRPVDAGTAKYREIYWRVYVKYQSGWIGGGGYKMSRVQILANSSWGQAMVAPVWGGDTPQTQNYLLIDPTRGTDSAGTLLATTYGDFAHLTFLGAVQSVTPLFDAAHVGSWYCVEAHVRLNDPGSVNGMFELWINGNLEAQHNGLNWVGSYSDYGINTMFLESYWNTGATQAEDRYFDNLVVSTERIGC